MKILKPEAATLLDYQCMFFDFDGVVLESGNIKTDAFIELFAGLGIDDEVKQHHLENQGVSRYEKFRWITEHLLKEEYTEVKKQELGDRFASLVKQKVIAAAFVGGFEEMIAAIRAKGIYCVIASGTPDQELKSIVEERQIAHWFDEVHGSPRKKDQIVNDVLGRKPFNKKDCLFYGDASTDYEAAKAVGIDFFARLTNELADYWQQADYQYGMEDFTGIV